VILAPKPASDLLARNLPDETIETIDDITRKKSAAKPIITEREQDYGQC
jgi:hypothetical protein